MTRTHADEEELMRRKRRGDEANGLNPLHEYLAQYRATGTFWGDAPLGDTSLTAGASSLASWHFEQLSVDPENGHAADRREGRTLGRVRSQWVEKGAVQSSGVDGWSQKAESGAMADGWSQRQWAVKKAEPEGEWVGCQSQARRSRTSRQE